MKSEKTETLVDGIRLYVSGEGRDAVLLIHEWWGLNDVTKRWADEIAALGYRAVALDLFDGKVTKDTQVAARYMEEADPKQCLEKLGKVLRWMHDKNGLGARRVATIGWCFGGGWSLQCALQFDSLVSGSVIYYGKLETDVERLKGCTVPLLGIFADKDTWITTKSVEAFRKACRQAGVSCEIFLYEGDHAFANPTHPNYDSRLARDAFGKVSAFFTRVFH